MNKDESMEEQNEQYRASKEKIIKEWVKSGASRVDAEQLYEDMKNDPAHSDPNREDHDDPTIDERLVKYSGKKK